MMKVYMAICGGFKMAPPHHHRTRQVHARLNELFGDQVVALHRPIEWPPLSPDLTPCDFFLWGYVESKVFRSPPENVFNLRYRIIQVFEELRLNREMIASAMQSSMRTRCQKCIDRNGQHIEGFLI
jgi:hypothetical protein